MSYILKELGSGQTAGLLEGIGSMEEWKAKREEIMVIWQHMLGTPPIPDLYNRFMGGGFNVLSETVEEDHRRQHIAYDTLDGDRVTAFLLLPNGGCSTDSKLPAVLALHPTAPEGKADVSLASGRENRKYGLELVFRGYIVLAPDSITAGERVYPGSEPFQTAPFYDQYPEWTAVGKIGI